MQANLYILANSPGEMSGWVAPVVAQARQIMPQLHITVALIPDWFSHAIMSRGRSNGIVSGHLFSDGFKFFL